MPFLLRDLIFTPNCINCTKLGEAICAVCLDRMQVETRSDLPGLDLVKCAGEYSGWLRDRLIQYKSGHYQLGRGLAEVIFGKCANELKDAILVPIPTSKAKLAQRQLDLVANLAKHLARFEKSIRVVPSLQLIKNIPDQVGLSASQRAENLSNVFICNQRILGAVIVLDDVVTTGATISSAAVALKRAGATSVSAIGLCAATKLH